MRSKGGLGSVFFRNPTHAGRHLGSRQLWTRSLEYSQKNSTQIVFQTNCFKSSTVRGAPFFDFTRNPFRTLFWDNSIYEFLFRGMSKAESDEEPINKALGGLVGRRAHLLQHKDPDVVRETLEEHQSGHIAGISLTKKFRRGLSFSAFLGKGHEVFIVDERNIPKKHLLRQDYSGFIGYTTRDDELNYTYEKETTPPAFHRSCALCRINREGWNVSIEHNPLYVDQDILTKELQQEYRGVLKKFYNISSFIRTKGLPLKLSSSEEQVIKEYEVAQKKFYLDMIEELKGTVQELDEAHEKAIVKELTKNPMLEIVTSSESQIEEVEEEPGNPSSALKS
ncbi:Uncharacterised protein [Legionella steigerwaltii]|uniref:Uncharacterized protein n=1 Tax=Legionella steigerwaltii TaxID=460 RepID=A0A378LDP2_9GAMM|nr:hypothetical protein [Legionella steigerwaltii]KTD79624.1 hypothetical protein Lstg_0840 [Legionella steigerwaltii]STY24490.1 Uncharacterised protein [Legionella steigerwaltii]